MPFQQQKGMFFYTPEDYSPRPYTAAFDVDWTVTFSQHQLFPKDEDDIYLLPNRLEKLQEFYDEGFNIVFITNQSAKSKKEKEKKVGRMTTLINLLPFPCYVFISTDKDEYRKPEIGMWTKVKELIPNMKLSLYCGDAAGRPQDFADSDKLFAHNAGIKFYTPEEVFNTTEISFTGVKEMVVFVGMPGSGKSSFYRDHLQPLKYEQISQDILKTKPKVLKATRQALVNGLNVAIDGTNPTLEGRQEFYALAEEYGYSVTVVYLTRDGRGWNDLRGDDRVSTIVYHVYHKKLEPPTDENTPGKLYLVS